MSCMRRRKRQPLPSLWSLHLYRGSREEVGMLRLRGSSASLHSRSAQQDSQIRFTCGVHPVLEDPLVRVSPLVFIRSHVTRTFVMLSAGVRRAKRPSLRSRSIPTFGTLHPRVPLCSQIGPVRVPSNDQCNFPCTTPSFELRLPCQGFVDVVV